MSFEYLFSFSSSIRCNLMLGQVARGLEFGSGVVLPAPITKTNVIFRMKSTVYLNEIMHLY